MTNIIIPISDHPSQTLTVTLSGQQTTINLYQKSYGVFCDVYVNNSLVIGGVICQNLNKIVRDTYLGFVGDLFFYDSQGVSDPVSPGLGTRFQLIYSNTAT